MIQSMIMHLNGFEPLQKKILLYCFATDTAVLMQPIVLEMEKRRQTTEDINCETAWRCHTPKKYNEEKQLNRPSGYSLQSYLASKEMDVAKLTMLKTNSVLKAATENSVRLAQKSMFNAKYGRLTQAEKNGTPTGIIIRKYMTKLFMKGLKLRGNETMWARFSDYKILDRSGCPMESNSESIILDLEQAIQQRIIEYKLYVSRINNK